MSPMSLALIWCPLRPLYELYPWVRLGEEADREEGAMEQMEDMIGEDRIG